MHSPDVGFAKSQRAVTRYPDMPVFPGLLALGRKCLAADESGPCVLETLSEGVHMK